MNLKLAKQFSKYGTVGIVAVGVDVATFTLVRALNLDLVSANVLARFAGAVAAFMGNFLWTFDQTRKLDDWLQTSWRYAAVWVAATATSTLILSILIKFELNETLCKLAVELLMPILNFMVVRLWVFRDKSKQ